MEKKIALEKNNNWKLSRDSDVVDDPLTDCLVILAKFHGRSVGRSAVRAGMPLVNNKLTVKLFPRAAQRLDLSSRILQRPLAEISNLALPAILLLNDNKAAILVKTIQEKNSVVLILPESGEGEETVLLDELEPLYTGYAIFVHPRFKAERKNLSAVGGAQEHWFWGTLLSSWRVYRDVLLASFLINVFGLTTPFFVLNVYDRVIPNNAFSTLWVLAAGIGIIYLFALLMRILRGYFIDEAGKKANLQMSSVIFEKVLGLKMSARPNSIGSFSNKIQQFDSVRDFITSLSITAIVDLPFVALGLLAIWYLAGQIVFIHIGAIVILLVYTLLIQVPLQKSVEQTFHASARKNAVLVEGLNGLETLKILGAESKIQRTWEESVGHISRWSAKSRLLSTSVNNLSNFVQGMTVVVVVVAGVYSISKGTMSQGGLIAIVILTRQAIAPMAQVVSLATRYHRARTAFQAVQDVMDMPTERPPQKTFLHRSEIQGSIEFKNVSFTYPDQTLTALKDVSLTIKPGEKVGIIGAIGSGKSTFAKLLLGLYEPDTGMVAMDGTDIRQMDPTELRRFIGCVPQDVTLFRGTIRDNIVLGSDNATDADILRAADLAGVSVFAKRHAKGFDMPVGEQGRVLSGGQRQTVAMARAVLNDPPILLLDEPSSSMDARTEGDMCRRLIEILQDKTLILVTHRASLLSMVDRLIVLDNGIIRADGPKDNILDALKNGQLNF